VCTDSAQALTHGSPVGPIALLSRLNPTLCSYTGVYPTANGSLPLIGHMQHAAGDRSAHLAFLMPEPGLAQPGLVNLLEHLAAQAGSWGAFHLLAEVEEDSCALEGLRRSGFSVYAWQRIWKFAPATERSPAENIKNDSLKNGNFPWQPATSIDENSIRNLYQSLVPPLVQSAEPLTSRRLLGWVYRQEGEIWRIWRGYMARTAFIYSRLIHPAVENVSQVLSCLLQRQPNLLGRPIYLAIRSYQAWLETVVRDLECQVGPRQALMVKHLVLQQRVALQAGRHSVLEKYTAEPTVPMVHNSVTMNE
jgi:hypothetical protein